MMVDDIAAGIKLLILDVDGVMTDGRITINERGQETKSFDVKDGQGLKLLMNAGVEVIIVSGRSSGAVDRRAGGLGIREVHQGVRDKAPVLKKIMQLRHLKRKEVCCMGDDLPDLAMFRLSGLSVAVADAAPELRDRSDFTTKNQGGRGAVREVCEMILKARGAWEDALEAMLGGKN